MTHFLKGAAAVAIVLMISLGIHVFCNMQGIGLNTTVTATVSAMCAVAVYHVLISNEHKNDGQE